MRLIYAERFEELFNQQVELGATDLFDAVEDALQDTESIDPETLPIVLELREKLERVTKERDSYKIFFEDITKCGDCNDCGKSKTCEFVPKVGQTTRYNCPLWTGR